MNDRDKRSGNESLQSGEGRPATGQDERELGAGGQAADPAPENDDLQRNPGIGQSKGSFATGVRPREIAGDNTVEGDVDNDSTAAGGVPERELGRTNA